MQYWYPNEVEGCLRGLVCSARHGIKALHRLPNVADEFLKTQLQTLQSHLIAEIDRLKKLQILLSADSEN